MNNKTVAVACLLSESFCRFRAVFYLFFNELLRCMYVVAERIVHMTQYFSLNTCVLSRHALRPSDR